MTICLATTHFSPVTGGIANYYNCLAGLLTDAGHRVILLTVSADPGKEEEVIPEDLLIKVTLYSSYRQYLRHYSQYFRPGSYAADSWIATGMAMRDWLIKNSPVYEIDLVETMDYGGAGVFLNYPGLPPLVIDAHSSAIQIDREYPMNADDHLTVIKKLESLSFQHAAAIIAHSPMNAEDIRTMTGRTVVFCRAPWKIPDRPPDKRQPVKNRFLVISSLQMIKGAEIMIKAAAYAGKEMDNLCVYWAGEDSYSAPGGRLTSAYLKEKYPETWDKQFVWLNQKTREEINLLLKETEAVIVPSLWDTFNYVVPETIYHDTPLILSDKTGAAYLSKENPVKRIFKAGDARALANLLINLKKAEINRELRLSPDHLISDYFSPANILNERIPVYEEIIKKATDPLKADIKELSSLLDSYTTPWRKYYYLLRKKLKTVVRRDFNKLNHQ